MRRRPITCLVLVTCFTLPILYNIMLGLLLVPLERSMTYDSRSLLEWLDVGHWPADISADFPAQLHFRPSTARFDSSRRYKIHDFVAVGRRWEYVSGGWVCLATQTSLDRFAALVELSAAWQGPVSVAIFTPDQEFPLAILYVAFLRSCFPAVNDNVSFHVVYPADRPPAYCSRLETEPVNLTCSDPYGSLGVLLKMRPLSMMQWRDVTLYPQNHLRNVARKNCQSPYVFQTDVDIVPRLGLATALSQFLRRHDGCEGCAFVVPTYEVEASVPILPRNKNELVRLVREHKAQPFHKVIFDKNQFATNNNRWERIPETEEMDATYIVTKYKFFYEPFYVSKDSVPPHDERFVGYGFTRNTQVYEMVFAGYKLWVLNNAFAVHRGLVKRKSLPNKWRRRQNTENAIRFRGFKREVASRYYKENNRTREEVKGEPSVNGTIKQKC